MPWLDARGLLLFAGRFAAIYAAIFALAWSTGLFARAEAIVVAIAGRQLASIEEPEIRRQLELDPDGALVQTVSTPRVRNVRLTSRDAGFVSHNAFLFLALVLATPGLGWRLRLGALAVGGVVVLALDVLVVMSVVWHADRIYLASTHPGISSGPLAQVVHVVGALHPTGGAFMAPVLLWGLALFAMPLFSKERLDGEIGRNEPCPCGSGLKYKRCCGA